MANEGRSLSLHGAEDLPPVHGNSALHQLATQRWDIVQQELPQPERFQPDTTSPVPVQQAWRGSVTNISLTAWLLDHGAQLNSTNHAGRTPLDVLCAHRWGYWDRKEATNRIALLVRAGAKTSNLDDAGRALLREVVGDGATPSNGR